MLRQSFSRALRALALVVVGLVLAGAAQAGVGLRVLPPQGGLGEVTLWYPSDAADSERELGPYRIAAAWGAPPRRGNGRLVVLSHGSGGGAWPHHDLARTLVQAGFIVAAPEHAFDNWRDDRELGPRAWQRRPREISATIDRVAAEPAFAALFDVQRVGVYGMSAGGLTALVLAGARWHEATLAAHCAQHADADPGFCDYGTRSAHEAEQRRQFWRRAPAEAAKEAIGHDEPRVRAVVAAVPVGIVFDPASLAHLRTPTALVVASEDRVLLPRWHVDRVRAACSRCDTLAVLDGGGHDAVLSPWPDVVARHAGLSGPEAAGFDRGRLPALYRKIARFFEQQL